MSITGPSNCVKALEVDIIYQGRSARRITYMDAARRQPLQLIFTGSAHNVRYTNNAGRP
jgi:hypothetical protein